MVLTPMHVMTLSDKIPDMMDGHLDVRIAGLSSSLHHRDSYWKTTISHFPT